MLAFYKNITVSGRLHFRDVDGDLPVLSLGLFASTKDGIEGVGRFALWKFRCLHWALCASNPVPRAADPDAVRVMHLSGSKVSV